MPSTKPRPRRVQQIAAIHVLKTKMGLDDDTYRAMLAEQTGKTSSAGLDDRQRERVLDHLRALEREVSGGAPPETPTPRRGWMEFRDDDPAPVRKICAMWIELGKAGRVERTTRQALNAWVKRQVGVDEVGWVTSRQATALIEQLKEWTDRTD